jgi:hypothetical protein
MGRDITVLIRLMGRGYKEHKLQQDTPGLRRGRFTPLGISCLCFPFARHNQSLSQKRTEPPISTSKNKSSSTSISTNGSPKKMSSDCASSCCSSDWDTLVTSIRVMRQRETNYVTSDYLHQSTQLSCCDEPVDVECRAKMGAWCMHIIDHCQFNRETVAIAMNILDRFVEASTWALEDRSAYQLAAITSLYTAIKVHEPMAIALQTMANLSRNVYSAAQIEAMERVMLETNKWLIHPPTSYAFSHYFCELIARADHRYAFETLLDLTKLQLESSLQDYELSLVPASSVAFAAVMNAAEGMALSPSQGHKQELEHRLASATQIDSTSSSIQDVQIRLYEGLWGTNLLEPSCGSPVRPGSPRSVSVVRAVSPH